MAFDLPYYETKLQKLTIKISKAKDYFLNSHIQEMDKFLKEQQEMGIEYKELQAEIEKFKTTKDVEKIIKKDEFIKKA